VLCIVGVRDRAFAGTTRCHLFCVETMATTLLRAHLRVASVDPRSYGTAARQNGLKGGFSKSDTYVAHEMVRGYREQLAHDRAARDIFVPADPTFAFQRPPNRAIHAEVGSPGCR
jgi:hypothetical protein